jgi:hypothetical protein
MAWMDKTMLLKFFGISEPLAATKCRCNCRARSEGELLHFESVVGESYERAVLGERSVDIPSIPCVTVTMSNASILDQVLVRVTRAVANDWPYATDHLEVLWWDVTATIQCCL